MNQACKTFGTSRSWWRRWCDWLTSCTRTAASRYSVFCGLWKKARICAHPARINQIKRRLRPRRPKSHRIDLIFRQRLRAEALDDALTITARVRFDGFFVESEQSSLAHHDAAFDDHGAHIASLRCVNQVRI